MKHLNLVIILIMLSMVSLAQKDTLNVRWVNDSSQTQIVNYDLWDVGTIMGMSQFDGIPSRWTLILKTQINEKDLIIPIDSTTKDIEIRIEANALGYCNCVLWWSACDKLEIYEHGNGCTYMNTIIINGCGEGDGELIFDGQRVVPFEYENRKNK